MSPQGTTGRLSLDVLLCAASGRMVITPLLRRCRPGEERSCVSERNARRHTISGANASRSTSVIPHRTWNPSTDPWPVSDFVTAKVNLGQMRFVAGAHSRHLPRIIHHAARGRSEIVGEPPWIGNGHAPARQVRPEHSDASCMSGTLPLCKRCRRLGRNKTLRPANREVWLSQHCWAGCAKFLARCPARGDGSSVHHVFRPLWSGLDPSIKYRGMFAPLRIFFGCNKTYRANSSGITLFICFHAGPVLEITDPHIG